MGEALEKIANQISAYEILNSVIPGAVYSAVIERITEFKLLTRNFWVDLVICYFVGLLIGRIGSLVAQGIRKATKKTNDPDYYKRFISAEKKDMRIRDMIAINNMYRTFISVSICILLTFGFGFVWKAVAGIEWIKTCLIVVGCALVASIFYKSYQRQKSFVEQRVTIANMVNIKNDK